MSIENLIILSIILEAIVGVILWKQIESQKTMLNSYQDYIKTVDWEKVKKVYEEVFIPAEKTKWHSETVEWIKNWEADNKTRETKDELIRFARRIIGNLRDSDPDFARQTVEKNFPNSLKYFQDILEDRQ